MSKLIARLAPDAGANSDGFVEGAIRETTYVAVIANAAMSNTIYSHRKDTSASGVQFTDISSTISNDTIDDTEPFGTTLTMSANDLWFIACDQIVQHIYIKIEPGSEGIWAGTGLKFYDSTDGITPSHELLGITDSTNGLRNSGIFKITLPESTAVNFSPIPGDIASKKWIVVKLDGFTGVTRAPKVSRIWLEHDVTNIRYVDGTARANGDIAVAPILVNDTIFPSAGLAVYSCTANPASSMIAYSFRGYADIWTMVFEYLCWWYRSGKHYHRYVSNLSGGWCKFW